MRGRRFATFLWRELPTTEIAWDEAAAPPALPGEADVRSDEPVRHGRLARALRALHGAWLTFPAGSHVLGTEELVYLELPAAPSMLYAMCGVSFSGKSTFAAKLARRIGATVISLDAILAGWGLFGGDGLDVEHWERASFEAMTRARALATRGGSIILDDTCCRRFLRERYRSLADELELGFLVIYLDASLETVRERIKRAARTSERRTLRPDVFEAHVTELEQPAPGEAVVRVALGQDERWIGAIADRFHGG